jgi:hypothetical protein
MPQATRDLGNKRAVSRDDFREQTRTVLARRVAYLCSNPDCRQSTIGPQAGGDGVVVLGQAAHITAASPLGPRYEEKLRPDERRSQDNGIWLCLKHARQVDVDETAFPVGLLRDWKKQAEARAIADVSAGVAKVPQVAVEFDEDDLQFIERLGLRNTDFSAILTRAVDAARHDIRMFKQEKWPTHALRLELTSSDGNTRLDVERCAAVVQATRDLVIVAPPGTGKTTTSIQLVEEILFTLGTVRPYTCR